MLYFIYQLNFVDNAVSDIHPIDSLHSVRFFSVLFCSIMFCSALNCSVVHCSVLIYSIQFYSSSFSFRIVPSSFLFWLLLLCYAML